MDEATARPWAAPNPPDGPGEGMVWGADGITVCEMYWSTEEKRRRTAGWRMPDIRSDGSHIANAALIVEAVNAYDRLRVIEAAARAYVAWQYRVPGAPRVTLSDLRAALEVPPMPDSPDPREREEPRP